MVIQCFLRKDSSEKAEFEQTSILARSGGAANADAQQDILGVCCEALAATLWVIIHFWNVPL